MRCHLVFLAALAIVVAAASEAQAVTNVFEYPLVFRKHQQLTGEFQQAMRRKDLTDMERACRTGVALLPENPVWRYNLACALTLQKRTSEALETLDRAVILGFRDANAIASDKDLDGLRTLPAFQDLLAKARNLRHQPVEGQPMVSAAPLVDGTAHVSASNTVWDLEVGAFHTFFALPTNAPPPADFAPRWNGPAAALIRPWLAANSAAGNFGDFYDNRDDGHARLDCAPFAGLTPIQYDADARRFSAHYGLDLFLYNGVVLGNSSVAITSGAYWRSLPRGALTDGSSLAFLFTQYLRNHLYCYPSHHDHDAAGLGDLYPVNQPYLLISQGSSGSDQPFLKAFAATLAAFRPETKRWLAERGLVMPTMQMLLRASQKTVVKPEDYLTGAAHPTVFDAANLDVERMVQMAHDLTTNDIPPVVSLRTLADTRAVPGVDFFDPFNGEALYDSPCVISRILRSTAHRHTMTVGAQLSGAPTDGWQLHWVVLRGDPHKINFLSHAPTQAQMELSVAYHSGRFPVQANQPLQSSRVDIGIIASKGQRYSAPAFISLMHLNNERRTYSTDGRILAMDYEVAATNYVDPVISLAKHWRDEYQYAADLRPIGWTRHLGETIEHFNLRGERVEETDKLGRATLTHTVTYIPRSSADPAIPPDLIQVDGDLRMSYRYASDSDFTGEVVSRERGTP